VARIEPEALERDWYNDYAAFVLALGNAMEDDSNDGKRRAILAALTDTLSKS
jgi:hypothetical protein